MDSLGLKMVPVCFTCVLSCGFRCCWAGNGHGFRFQRSGTEVDEGGLSMDNPSPCLFGPKMFMCYLHDIA